MKRVLIVDDEEDILLGLSRYLKRHGYEVVVETSPRRAIEILSTEPADILITDVKMDELSGLDLIEEAKKRNKDIKIIVMTARGSDELERLAVEKGASGYIEKPFDIDYLLNVLKELEKGGFKGVVKELSITDMLNILNVEKANAVINISSTAGTGKIYMENGEIVHAQFGDLEGLDALKAIFSLEGGTFSVEKGAKAPKKTIDVPFNNLMLEIFAQIDEDSSALSIEGSEETLDFDEGSIFSGIIEEGAEILRAEGESEKEEAIPMEATLPDELKETIEGLISGDSKVESIEIYDLGGNLLMGTGKYRELARGILSLEEVSIGFIEQKGDRLIYFEAGEKYVVILTLIGVSISLAKVEYSKIIRRIFELLKEV